MSESPKPAAATQRTLSTQGFQLQRRDSARPQTRGLLTKRHCSCSSAQTPFVQICLRLWASVPQEVGVGRLRPERLRGGGQW